MTVAVYNDDCVALMARLPADSIHACVTDPPYNLASIVKRFGNSNSAPVRVNESFDDGASKGSSPYLRTSAGFMGQKWDSDVAFQRETWDAVYRVLKPGAYLVAFGGTRTYHRMACAIEDSGFVIRDQLAWVYGSGFPKSHNISNDLANKESTASQADQWEGWGSALKPAWEPICLAQKSFKGAIAANVLKHGAGGLHIDACRVHGDDSQGQAYTVKRLKPGAKLNATGGTWRDVDGPDFDDRTKDGRFPANLIHDGSDEVLECFPAAPGQIANVATGAMARGVQEESRNSDNEGVVGFKMKPGARRLDSGSAARFFYCAKASKAERAGSKHPTVKPIALMQHLVRLVTPPGGCVLDPFAGSGTTGVACKRELFHAVLIEQDATYCADTMKRLEAEAA